MQLAFEYPTGTFPNELRLVPALPARPEVSREIKILGLLLIAIQVLDGLLTAAGVLNWGTAAEGNYLIRTLMDSIGLVPALIVVKSLAILIVLTLCGLSSRISWVGSALKTVIAIYLVAAIVPWALLLAFHSA